MFGDYLERQLLGLTFGVLPQSTARHWKRSPVVCCPCCGGPMPPDPQHGGAVHLLCVVRSELEQWWGSQPQPPRAWAWEERGYPPFNAWVVSVGGADAARRIAGLPVHRTVLYLPRPWPPQRARRRRAVRRR